MFAAAAAATRAPTAVLPVNATLSTPGWATRAAAVDASPVITFSTPAGRPDRSAARAMTKASKLVCSAGLRTTVHPASRAGAILLPARVCGLFHAGIAATTPTGRWVISVGAPRTRALLPEDEVGRHPRGVAEEGDHVPGLEACLCMREAGLGAEQFRQLRALGGERIGERAEVAGPLLRAQPWPVRLLERAACRGHGSVHVLGTGHGDPADDVLRRRVDDDEWRLRRARRQPTTVDEEPRLLDGFPCAFRGRFSHDGGPDPAR